tara:strand:- start:19895 stop:21214 length:1320 start_codon:yes stop_codon:yes gene_type:complete
MRVSGVNYIEQLQLTGPRSGPRSGPKSVLLIGDIHNHYAKDACPMISRKYFETYSITDYLDHILKSDPEKSYDFYLEQTIPRKYGMNVYDFLDEKIRPEKVKEITGSTPQQYAKDVISRPSLLLDRFQQRLGSLDLIRSYFMSKNCFAKDESNCPYPNSRFHFIDVRQRTFGKCQTGKMYNKWMFSLTDLRAVTSYSPEEVADGVIGNYVDSIINVLRETMEDCKFTETKTYRQLLLSPYGHAILEMYHGKISVLDELLKECYEIWNSNRDELVRRFKRLNEDGEKYNPVDWISGLYEEKGLFTKFNDAFPEKSTFGGFDLYADVLFMYLAVLMDIYALGRMTKNYNQYVIVVAGKAHIERYREFFLSNGWSSEWVGKPIKDTPVKDEYGEVDTHSKCIEIPDTKVGGKKRRKSKKSNTRKKNKKPRKSTRRVKKRTVC